ncbi:YeiH family protein [Rhizobium sp. RM]|uniref:YeiH family protein n=1 Tax=Rhizobium sp. RM TaxID=2748079 RepID=UPI00110EB707|nr:YeiH family protein [Rhizobium sp. RM]NWJ24946.1 YeiH family putative sulfate export transporter [Rhizobium sp. RM]TMV16727.1 YeiH family putative sulfate export transporter [Rhizobium sp. Td3]
MQHHRAATQPFHVSLRRLTPLLPGILLCAAVSCAAILAETFQARLVGHAWLGDLVLAILFGTALRSLITLPAVASAGIKFSAKTLLEIAVALLGASLSLSILKGAGGLLIGGIALIVALSLVVSYFAGRMLGLPPKLATLIACGNSICGNSAIAAAAPAIGAKPEDVAASIAFTAVLGVAAVLLMPFLPSLLGLDATQYGIFAGLTVYAVPQVLAATAPLGTVAVQTGTIVKLIRVLMLGPVIATLSLIHGQSGTGRLKLQQMVPWFIICFVLMIMARSFGLIPQALLGPVATLSNVLTIMSMAALGLSVDIRSLRHAGGRVIAAASLSLVLLGVLSLGLIALTQTA